MRLVVVVLEEHSAPGELGSATREGTLFDEFIDSMVQLLSSITARC